VQASLWYYAAAIVLYLPWAYLKPVLNSSLFSLFSAIINGGFTVSAMLFFIDQVKSPEKTKWQSTKQGLVRGYVFILLAVIIGAGCLFPFLTGGVYSDLTLRMKDALILGTGAICHNHITPAGGDFYPDRGPYDFRHAYILQIVMGIVALMGALGYLVCADLLSIKRLRERMRNPSVGWSRHVSFIIAYLTIIAILGSGIFYLIEHDRFLHGEKFTEACISSFFHVTMTIGSGYSYINSSGDLTVFTSLFLILLIVIGNPVGSAGIGLHPEFFYGIIYPKARKYLLIALAAVLIVMLLTGYYFFRNDFIKSLFLSSEAFAHNWLIAHRENLPPAFYTSLITFPLRIAGKILMPLLCYVYSHVFFHKELRDIPD
jgi:hypothetical protein